MALTSAQPSYSGSAYTGSPKGKRDNSPSTGGKGALGYLEGVSPRGKFAGTAPSGQVIMSGGKTGLGMLKRGLANMPVLVSTWEGDQTDIDFKLKKVPGCPSPDDAGYL